MAAAGIEPTTSKSRDNYADHWAEVDTTNHVTSLNLKQVFFTIVTSSSECRKNVQSSWSRKIYRGGGSEVDLINFQLNYFKYFDFLSTPLLFFSHARMPDEWTNDFLVVRRSWTAISSGLRDLGSSPWLCLLFSLLRNSHPRRYLWFELSNARFNNCLWSYKVKYTPVIWMRTGPLENIQSTKVACVSLIQQPLVRTIAHKIFIAG